MKTILLFGKKLSRSEMKEILGGSYPPSGGSCGIVCPNCAALSFPCSGDATWCECTSNGCKCCWYDYPGPLVKECGPFHSCPSGNYCG